MIVNSNITRSLSLPTQYGHSEESVEDLATEKSNKNKTFEKKRYAKLEKSLRKNSGKNSRKKIRDN